MECKSECGFPKKMISVTSIQPGMFNDDLYFRFTADGVHTSDPKEIDKMFAELDAHVARYKERLREHIAKRSV
jgi:hypothetical protein